MKSEPGESLICCQHTGNFGTIDLTTGKTTRLLSDITAAHGMLYDPFTGDLILGGGDHIRQYDLTSKQFISDLVVPGDQFDQGTVDGNGHLFWADNHGRVFFMDYSNTGMVADPNNFVSNEIFKDHLDDIAPLIGSGGTNQIPEPSVLSLIGLAFGALALLSGSSDRRPRRSTVAV